MELWWGVFRVLLGEVAGCSLGSVLFPCAEVCFYPFLRSSIMVSGSITGSGSSRCFLKMVYIFIASLNVCGLSFSACSSIWWALSRSLLSWLMSWPTSWLYCFHSGVLLSRPYSFIMLFLSVLLLVSVGLYFESLFVG